MRPADATRPSTDRTPITLVAGGREALELVLKLALGLAGSAQPSRVAVIAECRPDREIPGVHWTFSPAVELPSTSADARPHRIDLVGALRGVLESAEPPDHVLVLVPAERSVVAAARTVLADPDVQRVGDLDGVLATADAVELSTRLALDLPFDDELGLERLSIADRVLVARAGEVTDGALDQLLIGLRSLNRLGYIAAPGVAPLDIGAVLDLDAWHGAPTLAAGRIKRELVLPDGCERPTTVCCDVEGLVDTEAFEAWVRAVQREHGPDLLRIQGALVLDANDDRVCFRGVGGHLDYHSEDDHPDLPAATRSVVTVVGRGLDADALELGFAGTRSV